MKKKKKYEFWTDKLARKIIERKKFYYTDDPVPRFKNFVVKTSASLSGVLHIGRLSDTIRGEAVHRSLKDRGVKTELIWVAEDMDPLRKVPEGVPRSYVDYIGMPVTDIPDPDGCHKSYAEHHVSEYFKVLDEFISSKMKKFSMREEYKKGNFKKYIKILLNNVETIIEIQNKYRKTKLSRGWSPWTPICENCGKIITPRVTKFEDGKIFYKCEDYVFEKHVAKGCGYEGENDPLKGNGKLMWKSEWAAQWARWNVCSEGAGKEYQVPGSAFWVNGEIVEKVLKFPMPVPIFYEHLIIDGQKMSASLGNVVYPHEWLRIAPPELLRLLYLKDPMRVRDFKWQDVPRMFDERDELERIYYGKKKIRNERDRVTLSRLFEMIQTKPPQNLLKKLFNLKSHSTCYWR
jgi:lysyl-tRNA synthetase class 1